MDEVIHQPSILLRVPLVWGKFLSAAGERQEEVHQAIIEAAAEPVVTSHPASRLEPYPLHLNLPHDALLIPHWFAAVTTSPTATLGLLRGYSPRDAEAGQPDHSVHRYLNDPLQLESVADDHNQPIEVRASAAMMFLLHPDGSKDLTPWQSLLVEAWRPGISSWYLRGVVMCLTFVAAEEDRVARLIVGGLLERTRTSHKGTQQLQQLLDVWREASSAPVDKAGVQDAWLQGV